MTSRNYLAQFTRAGWLPLLTVLLFTAGTLMMAGPPRIQAPEPEPRWAAETQTAVLFGINNENDYLLAPQILSLWWRPANAPWGHMEFGVAGIFEPVIQGPESFLGGGALTFRATWQKRRWLVHPYFTARLGAGAIDSRRVPEAQGQDFVFIAQGEAGIRADLTSSLSIQAGVLYQHISNAGLSEPERPNVGLDAFGPFLGLRYRF